MCRLTALTATNISNVDVARILHLAMIASQASDSQNKDGWGVASSWGQYMKNSGSFMTADQEWYQHVVNSKVRYTPALAHLRNSSAGTSVTAKEAQPFVFGVDDNSVSFVAMHNGRVDGSYNDRRGWQTGDPNSDSWRAFDRLHTMMVTNNHWTINAELITQWLNAYEDSSAYVFVIATDNDIHVVRNNQRDLHCMKCGNGFLITTSADAARFVRNSAPLFGISGSLFPDKDPLVFAQDKLYHLTAGSHDIHFEQLQLEMKKGTRVWTNNQSNFRSFGYEQQSYATPAAQTATEAKTETATAAGEDEETEEIERVMLSSGAVLLRPRKRVVHDDETRFLDDGDDDDESSAWQELFDRGQQALGDERLNGIIQRFAEGDSDVSPKAILKQLDDERKNSRIAAIREIKTILNPIRDTMLAMYIDMYELGMFSAKSVDLNGGFSIINNLNDISDEQIFSFLENLKANPEEHPTDKQARAILNKWNHAVSAAREHVMIELLFGNNLPITVPVELALGIINGIPAISA